MSKTLKSLLKDIAAVMVPMALIVMLVHFGANVSAGDAVGHYADDPSTLPSNKPAEGDNFSDEVSDLPVYDGMILKEDMNTVFDTPDGRIVDVYMEGPKKSEAKALKFYETTLPQLGWEKKTASNRPEELKEDHVTFSRGDEELVLTSSKEEDRVLFKFSIRPLED